MIDNNKKIIDALYYDNRIETLDIDKLNNLLDEEISRDNPDFDLIDEITESIIELKNIRKPEIDIDSEIRTIKRRGIKHSFKFRLPKFISVAVAVSTIVIVNLFASPFIADSVKNFFPAMYTQENKTILDFTNSGAEKKYENIIPDNSDYNIIQKQTALHGLDVYMPTEGIPFDDCTMYVLYTENNGIASELSFTAEYYEKSEKKKKQSQKIIDISYEIINSDNLDEKVIELSEDNVLDSGFIIDGMDAYVFFNRTAAEWPNCQRYYTMYFYQSISETEGILTKVDTIGLDHDEAYKIFKSFR